MSNMDAGDAALVGAIAAVLGAAVGAGGALGSAAITGRNQARTQNEHWRRQVRRDAYAALLGAVADCILAIDAARDLALGPTPSDLRQSYEAAHEALGAVRRAANLIFLEGPEPVADSCTDLVRSLDTWHKGLIGLRERRTNEGATTWMTRARTEAIDQLETFQEHARDVLDGYSW